MGDEAPDTVETTAVPADDSPEQQQQPPLPLTSATVREWLQAHHYKKQLRVLDQFQHELWLMHNNNNNNNDNDEITMVHKTVNVIRHLVGSTSWKTAAELLSLLKGLSEELKAAVGSTEPAIPNIIRRVMASVREEAQREAEAHESEETQPQPSKPGPDRLSLQSLLWALPQHVKSSSKRGIIHRQSSVQDRQESFSSEAPDDRTAYPPLYYQRAAPNLKQTVLEAMQELLSDLEDTHRSIHEQVTHHIHAGEVLLTTGHCRTVELFLENASVKHPNLTVIVCGNDPTAYQRVREVEKIHMTLAAAFAIMPRVHKVLLPAHAVLANGGLVGPSGSTLVALAASHYSVPVVCVTGIYKLCPVFPHEGQDTLQDWTPPLVDVPDTVETLQPKRDYVDPSYISLFITNVGAFRPTFVYRLLAENYHTDDWDT